MSNVDQTIQRWHAAVPEALRTQFAWVCWMKKPKPGKPGKFDKVPSYANGIKRHGPQGGAQDRAALVEFGDAVVAFKNGRFDGIGLALLDDLPYWALDLDNCIAPDGAMTALANGVVESGTYCEKSPSGEGIRAIFAGKIGFTHKNHEAGVETFDDSGFVTITGDRIGGEEPLECPFSLREDISRIVQEKAKANGHAAAPDMPKAKADISKVGLPPRLKYMLERPYEPGADRSKKAWNIAREFAKAGITREQALEFMSSPDVLAPALERRGGDIDSARAWMWKYCICRAYEDAGCATAQAQTQQTPQPSDWPEPVNLFAELAAPSFEATDLPEELATYAMLYARSTGFDPSLTLSGAVSAAAAALSDDIRICADSETRWFQAARLWFLAVAPPGAGKTPAQREMLGPLREIHKKLSEDHEIDHGRWERNKKDNPDDSEPAPPRPRAIVQDTTIEALADVLRDNPRGILIQADEFDSWLGGLDQYRSGEIGRDRGLWLSAFDGGPHTVERVKRGSMYVPNWGASILTASTPASLGKLLKHLPMDGLLQRFLLVIARRNVPPKDRPDKSEIVAEHTRYNQTIKRLWEVRAHAHNGIVPMSTEAKHAFDAWRDRNQRLQEAMGTSEPAVEAHLAKYPSMALRLALAFHAAKAVNNPDDDRARDPTLIPVQIETMERAFAFLHRASLHSLAFYLGRKGGSDAYEIARTIARFILARSAADNATGLQRRDLLRHVIAYKNAHEAVQIAALNVLADMGWLRIDNEGGYRKAAPTRYAVNPRIADRFAGEADRERERRQLLRERIKDCIHERREGLKT